VIQKVDLVTMRGINPTKTIESPTLATSLITPVVGQIGQTILPFTRTLEPLRDDIGIVSLSTSGYMVLPWEFDAGVALPVIHWIANAADGTTAVASGGLITVSGANLSVASQNAGGVPWPTTLAEACVTANDKPIPLYHVSPGTIGAQLPFGTAGNVEVLVRSPGGTSQPFDVNVLTGAPAVFWTGVAGGKTGLPTVVRVKNAQLTTLANPIHPEEVIEIYLTGLGSTSPAVGDGYPGPFDPPALTVAQPIVTLGGVQLPLDYAGLAPGQVGVYQINARIPSWVPTGMTVPLVITQDGHSTTVSIRVVN
jgi:uncharacterized protein (TIGR03437 family)